VKHGDRSVELRGLAAEAAAIGVDVGSEALDRLLSFEELLRDRALPLGLVAAGDASRLRERHLLDCLRAAPLVRHSDELAYDMGSGAGLPGLVVAIARPRLHVRLVEPRRARVGFLELAIERLGIPNATVAAGTMQEQTDVADVCLARAFAGLARSWEVALPRLGPRGRLVYFAGVGFEPPAAPAGARLRVAETTVLASAGPLIIMSR
jgi:16S rRNA (guanine527-N7)-methyltransferase